MVWKQSKRSRSKHKPPKVQKQRAQDGQIMAKDVKNDAQEQEWLMCPEKAPWVPSTPQGRLPGRQSDTMASEGEGIRQGQELPLPPQPTLPAPPAMVKTEDAISPEELKLLSHLRAIQEGGLELSGSLLEQKQTLEAKAKDASQKSLGHGHINKLDKAQDKANKAKARVQKLDQEWQKFANTMTMKIKTHSEMYQQSRAQLMAAYNQRLEELRQIKQDLASKTLMEQPEEDPELWDQAQFTAELQTTLQNLSSHAPILVEDDEEMIPDGQEEEADDVGQDAKKDTQAQKPSPHTTFRGSPNRVATSHLKVKGHAGANAEK